MFLELFCCKMSKKCRWHGSLGRTAISTFWEYFEGRQLVREPLFYGNLMQFAKVLGKSSKIHRFICMFQLERASMQWTFELKFLQLESVSLTTP